MVVLAALPGMGRELLVTGKLAKQGNFSASVNSLDYRIRKVGLGTLPVAPRWSAGLLTVRAPLRSDDREAPGSTATSRPRPAVASGASRTLDAVRTSGGTPTGGAGPGHALAPPGPAAEVRSAPAWR